MRRNLTLSPQDIEGDSANGLYRIAPRITRADTHSERRGRQDLPAASADGTQTGNVAAGLSGHSAREIWGEVGLGLLGARHR